MVHNSARRFRRLALRNLLQLHDTPSIALVYGALTNANENPS